MKKNIIIILVSILCNFISNDVKATNDQDNNQTFTHRQIFDTIFSQDLEKQQELCNQLALARSIIDRKLTSYQNHEDSFDSRENIIRLLTIFTSRKAELDGVHNHQIYQIADKTLTLEQYLHFCKEICHSKDSGSSIGCIASAANEVQQMLNHLGLKADPSNHDYKKVEFYSLNLKTTLKKPLIVTPFNLCNFAHNFSELKKITQDDPSYKEGILNPTYREIANTIASMSLENMHSFCQAVLKAKNLVRQYLLPNNYSQLSKGDYYPNRHQLLKDTKLILKAFENYEVDLKETKEFVIYKDGNKTLTLGQYLKAFVDLNPENSYQSWVPFYQRPRLFHIEEILKRLNFGPELQRSPEIQKLVNKLTYDFDNPLALTPLKMFSISQTFSELEKTANNYKRPNFVLEEDIEKWLLEHKATSIAGSAAAITLSLTTYFFFF